MRITQAMTQPKKSSSRPLITLSNIQPTMDGPGRESLKRETRSIRARRLIFWSNVMLHLVSQRTLCKINNSPFIRSYRGYKNSKQNISAFNLLVQLISTTTFATVFNYLNDYQILLNFRSLCVDLLQIVPVVLGCTSWYTTERSTYRITASLVTFVILKRLSTPHRWTYFEVLFIHHTPHLSEILIEVL